MTVYMYMLQVRYETLQVCFRHKIGKRNRMAGIRIVHMETQLYLC